MKRIRPVKTWLVMALLLSLIPLPVSGGDLLVGQEKSESMQHTGVNNSPPYEATELMPLTNRSGSFLLKEKGKEVPRELPFAIQEEESHFVLTKKGRVKHLLVHTDSGISIRGEVDLSERRSVTYDPPVRLLPSETPPPQKTESGQSSIEVSGLDTQQVSDTGTCSWSLSYQGTRNISLPQANMQVYRYKLEREIDLGFKSASLTVTFDYLPGTGQVRANVKQKKGALGMITGSRAEWTIQRIQQTGPSYQPGNLFRETNHLLLRRYERARKALGNRQPKQADRYFKQISKIIDRIDLSLTELDPSERKTVGEMVENLGRSVQRSIDANSLEAKRHRFLSVSDTLRNVLQATGHLFDEPVRVMRCARDEKFQWLSSSGNTDCPYLPESEREEPAGYPILLLNGTD